MMRTSGSAASSASACAAHATPGLPSISVRSAQQPAAEPEILVGEDHARARAPGRERRHQPGGTRADHQHVAMGEGLLVVVRIGLRPLARPSPAARRISGSYTASQNFAGHMKVL